MNQAAVAPSKVSGHTILAFDFGSRWVGVAVGDTETRIDRVLRDVTRKVRVTQSAAKSEP